MNGLPTFGLLLAAAYVAGSINVAILVFRFTGRDDPRRHGSGNPGATNVYRQAGIGWAVAVLLLDVGRAVLVAFMAKAMLPFWQVPWVGLGLILGNRFPCFHRFQGGKGVANYLGFTAVVAPGWAALGALAWGVSHLVWRTPFLSSFAMVFVLAAGTAMAHGGNWRGGVGAGVTALFIVACHHRNIRQRWAGKGQPIPCHEPGHAPANGPTQNNPAVFGAGQVHAQQEHQVGKPVGQRAADRHNGRVAIVDGRDAQKGNQGPADRIAESDGRHTGNHPQVGPPVKSTQVGPLGNGRSHEPGSGKPDD